MKIRSAVVAAQLPAGGATEGAVEGAEAAPTPPPFARGPLFAACLADGRKAATSARCGCVQAVANAELTNAQQRRGAKLWTDPATLQEIRQSDNASNEKFWRAWKAFAAKSVETCKAS